ncbi:MAG TPA: hypothetical protein DEA08_12665 [Planctomycetes bacterium]|nr:hypothetical protein [Planctomycetota bacterium]
MKRLCYYALEAETTAAARGILDQVRCDDAELLVAPDVLLGRVLALAGFEESEGVALWRGEGATVRVTCQLDRVRIEQEPSGELAPIHGPLGELFAAEGLALYWPERDELTPPPPASEAPRESSPCGVCGHPGLHFTCPSCELEVAGTCFRCHRDVCGAEGFGGLDALLGL